MSKSLNDYFGVRLFVISDRSVLSSQSIPKIVGESKKNDLEVEWRFSNSALFKIHLLGDIMK